MNSRETGTGKSTGRPCTICRHERLRDITADLMARRLSYRQIQARYGVTKSALIRHVSGHIPKALRKLTSDLTVASEIGTPVIEQMRHLNARTLRILNEAEAAEDRATALAAIRECRRNLELIAKLTGELDPRAAGEASGQPLTVVVNYVDKALITTPAPPAPVISPALPDGQEVA